MEREQYLIDFGRELVAAWREREDKTLRKGEEIPILVYISYLEARVRDLQAPHPDDGVLIRCPECGGTGKQRAGGLEVWCPSCRGCGAIEVTSLAASTLPDFHSNPWKKGDRVHIEMPNAEGGTDHYNGEVVEAWGGGSFFNGTIGNIVKVKNPHAVVVEDELPDFHSKPQSDWYLGG